MKHFDFFSSIPFLHEIQLDMVHISHGKYEVVTFVCNIPTGARWPVLETSVTRCL